jgi:ATP-dependent helicase/nuclease subunit A
LAVRDLGALLSFLATPEDSLSLATVLKSPLFGWSEQKLFDVAHHRTQEHLWQNLRNRSTEFPDTVPVLRDLRDNADFQRPYDLIERILTRHDGRRKLLGRLGVEAEDGINALLSQALAYERTAVPSLTGFIVWMKADDLNIKRQIDSASDQIRVMTVHGSKGLEAPIVILPDTGKRLIQVKNEIVKMGGVPVWKAREGEVPQTMCDALDDMKDAQRNEQLRLLYVALSRAEKWLMIAAAGDLGKSEPSWYHTVEGAMKHANALTASMPEVGPIFRVEHGEWDAPTLVEKPSHPPVSSLLEPYFSTIPSEPAVASKTLSPSDLGGAKALAGELGMDEETALSYGSLVHWHLEHPQKAFQPSSILSVELGDQAKAEAVAVLGTPELAHIFANETLAEVAITAPIGTQRVHGTIDRLLVTDTTVTAIDFKTNRVIPSTPAECPIGLLRQMGAYASALQAIYPNHKIETGILWTNTQHLMMLPHDLVTSALKTSPYLDL